MELYKRGQVTSMEENTRTGEMQKLMAEFRALYKEKLQRLEEDPHGDSEEITKMKMRIMKSYVGDLSEQNEVLVQTIEELETEANSRVKRLESKMALRASERDEACLKIECLEGEINLLKKENTRFQDKISTLQYGPNVISSGSDKDDNYKLQSLYARKDMATLASMVKRALKTGQWENLKSINFLTTSYEELFGEIELKDLRKASDDELSLKLKNLEEDLKSKDKLITDLQEELKQMNMTSLRTSNFDSGYIPGSRNRAGGDSNGVGITDKDIKLMKMQSDLRTATQISEDLSNELAARDGRIEQLCETVTSLREEVTAYEAEKMDLQEALEMLESKLQEDSRDARNADEEMRQMKREINILHERSVKCMDDASHFERLAHSLQQQLMDEREAQKRSADEVSLLQTRILESHSVNKNYQHELKREVMKREDMLQKTQRDNDSVESEKDRLTDELNALQQAHVKLSEDHKSLMNEVRKAKEATFGTEKQMTTMSREYDQSQRELRNSEEQIRHLESELASAKDQHKQTMGQVDRLTSSLHQLQDSFKNTRDALSSEVNERQDALSEARSELERVQLDHESNLVKVADQAAALDTLRREKNALSDEVSDLKIANSSLDAQLNECKSNLHDVNMQNGSLNEKLELAQLTAGTKQRDLEYELGVLKLKQEACENDAKEYQVKCKTLEEKLAGNDVKLRGLLETNSELSKKSQANNDSARQAEINLLKLQDESKRWNDDIARRDRTIKQLESDNSEVKKLCKEQQEENGKLLARMQALEITTQSEQEVLNSEVARKDEAVSRYKRKHSELEDKVSQLEAKLEDLARSNHQLQHQHSTALREVGVRDDSIRQLKHKLADAHTRHATTVEEASHHKQVLEHMKREANNFDNQLQNAKESIVATEERNERLKDDLATVQSQQKELLKRLASRDDMLHKVTVEATRLKEKYRLASSQSGQSNETIRMLEDELARTRVDLSETQRINDEESVHIKRQMGEMERDVTEQQQRYQACYKQLLAQEAEVAKLKEEREKLQEKIQDNSKELNQLRTYKHKTELDVAVLTEKHRTAQEEVSNRDQKLMKLNTELNTVHEQYKGTKEENEMHVAEIERLNAKVKQNVGDLKECREKIETQNLQLVQERGSSQQQKQKLESSEQELRVATKSCDHLQRELEAVKKDLKNDIATLQQENDRLRQQVGKMDSECKENKEDLDANKKHVKRLQEELTNSTKEQQDLLNELNKCEENLRTQLDEISTLKRGKLKDEDQMRTLKASLDSTAQQLSSSRHDHEETLSRLGDTQNDLQTIENQLAVATKEVNEKDELIEKLTSDISRARENIAEYERQVETCEDVVSELTNELQRGQEENRVTKHRVETMRDENDILSQRLVDKQQELAKTQSDLLKTTADLEEIQATHTHSNQEYNERQDQLLKLERELADVRGIVSDKQHQVEMSQKLIHELKSQLGEIELQKEDKEQEIQELEKELTKAQKMIDESEERKLVAVEQEKAKLATTGRQLEFERHSNEGFKEEIKQRDALLQKLRADLSSCHDNIAQKSEEMEQLEGTCNQMQVELDRAVRARNDSEKKRVEACDRAEEIGQTLEETRARYRECAQELAHYEERVLLKEQNLLGTQQELSEKVTDLARSEQLNKRLQAELKQVKDRCGSAEDEVSEQARVMSKQRHEIEDWKQQLQFCQEETQKCKETIGNINEELANTRAQNNTLQHGAKSLQNATSSLENHLETEKRRHAESREEVQKLNSQAADLINNIEKLESARSDLQKQAKDDQNHIAKLEDTLSENQRSLMDCRDEVHDLKNQLVDLERHLNNAQAQEKMRLKEIERYEDNLTTVQQDLEISQQQYKDCHRQLLDANQKLNDLKIQLSSIAGTNQESMDQLGQSSKENANLKSDLQKTWHENQAMAQEIAVYEEKLRKLRNELRKIQNVNKEAEDEVRNYEMKLEEMSHELSVTQDKNRQGISEIAKKEEQLVVLKVELAALRGKHKSLTEESLNNRQQLDTLQQKYASASRQNDSLRQELEQSRRDGSRLRNESEAVVENVNIWVQEQKQNNDRLSERLREQTQDYTDVVAERDQLQASSRQLKGELERMKQTLEDLQHEADKSKALQRHSGEQQNLILQLRNRLADSEREQDATVQEKNASLDDLHRRLKQNVDCIQQLNHQLNNLSKENMRQRSLVEQEIATRKNLQVQLDAKEQSLMGLRAQLEARSFSSPLKEANRLSASDVGLRRDKVTDAAIADARSAGRTNPEKLDKHYWVQRVGELSLQLQQSSAYWSDKVKDLSAQLDDSRLDNSFRL